MNEQEVNTIVEELHNDGPWFWEAPCTSVNNRLQSLKNTRTIFQNALASATGQPSSVLQTILETAGLESRFAAMHAMISTDLSAEMVDRARHYLSFYGISSLTIQLHNMPAVTVEFKHLPQRQTKLNRKSIEKANENDIHHDVLLLALYAGFSEELKFPTFSRCKMGSIAGESTKVNEFFQETYLSVSSQVRGGGSVGSGCQMQSAVLQELEEKLTAKGCDFIKMPDNRFPSHVGNGPQYDAVYKIGDPARCYISVEVAFQETTNSVIERKAKQAEGSRLLMMNQGFKACYVIGGAGWYARSTALRRLIRNADLCVSPKQIDKLAEYISQL